MGLIKIEFYITCRIEPQIALAKNQGFLPGFDLNQIYNKIDSIIPGEQPCLIHGDLWNGNVLYRSNDCFFIDPSISYSHREFDIAMMDLFGGFDQLVFDRYDEILPVEKGWKDRQDLFQLYYLLVHLNMFGSTYENDVKRIIRKYL